jgi:hypothetical protein
MSTGAFVEITLVEITLVETKFAEIMKEIECHDPTTDD